MLTSVSSWMSGCAVTEVSCPLAISIRVVSLTDLRVGVRNRGVRRCCRENSESVEVILVEATGDGSECCRVIVLRGSST